MSLNITLLTQALAENNNSSDIQRLFKAAGEINDDPRGAFKLIPHKRGLVVVPYKETQYEVRMGMHWFNDEDDQDEIADVVLYWDTTTDQLTSAQCCGVSFTHDEWKNR